MDSMLVDGTSWGFHEVFRLKQVNFMATEFPLFIGSAECTVIYDTHLQIPKQAKINIAYMNSWILQIQIL